MPCTTRNIHRLPKRIQIFCAITSSKKGAGNGHNKVHKAIRVCVCETLGLGVYRWNRSLRAYSWNPSSASVPFLDKQAVCEYFYFDLIATVHAGKMFANSSWLWITTYLTGLEVGFPTPFVTRLQVLSQHRTPEWCPNCSLQLLRTWSPAQYP